MIGSVTQGRKWEPVVSGVSTRPPPPLKKASARREGGRDSPRPPRVLLGGSCPRAMPDQNCRVWLAILRPGVTEWAAGHGQSRGGRRCCHKATACVFQEFADTISQLVTQKFRELAAGLASAHARHKALAGIVMTRGNASPPGSGGKPGNRNPCP